jgi:hypothetical protein
MNNTEKINSEQKKRIREIVRNVFIIKEGEELNKDGMFANKSRVVGLAITRIF